MDILKIVAAGIDEQTRRSYEKAGTSDSAAGAIGIILNSVYLIIGIVAVIYIILGGVGYATSQGDSAKLTKAKHTLIYAIVGLIISVVAFAITGFILNRLSE